MLFVAGIWAKNLRWRTVGLSKVSENEMNESEMNPAKTVGPHPGSW